MPLPDTKSALHLQDIMLTMHHLFITPHLKECQGQVLCTFQQAQATTLRSVVQLMTHLAKPEQLDRPMARPLKKRMKIRKNEALIVDLISLF